MNVSKPKLMAACVMSVCLVGMSARSQAQTATAGEATAPAMPPARATDGMFSPDRMTRINATENLLRNNYAVIRELLSNLEKFGVEPDRTADGPFDLTVSALRRLRAEEAISPLNQLIGFQLDPKTMPVGGFGGTLTYYPVVRALIEIGGGRELANRLLSRIAYPVDDLTLRARTYVLSKTVGNDLAKVLVQRELTDRLTKLKNIYKTFPDAEKVISADTGKQNLEKTLQLLENEDTILENPELKPPVLLQTPVVPANPVRG